MYNQGSLTSQRGVVHILAVLVLLAGIVGGLYLIQHPTIFKPKASEKTVTLNSITDLEKKIIEKTSENEKNIHTQQPRVQSVPVTPSRVLSASISSCGEITTGGDYSLIQDISTTDGNCILIHDTQNVNLDCQNFTITTNTPNPLVLSNLENFSIKNCTIESTSSHPHYPGPESVRIQNSSMGYIEDNIIRGGTMFVEDSNNIQIVNNIVNTGYFQNSSSSMRIINNEFKVNYGVYISNVVDLGGGNNNTIENNTIDGWVHEEDISLGTDDGIFIADESGDIISGNIISNNYDCGVETIGFIQNTQITNNKISNSGLCGIGGWYYHSWVGNTVDSNVVDGATYMFFMFYSNRSDLRDQSVYFKDNTFSNNTFLNQKSSSYLGPTGPYSSLIDLENLQSSSPLSVVELGNNSFKDNDFDSSLPAPAIIPTSMVVDQGGNKCMPVDDSSSNMRPLTCSNSTSTPTPSCPTPQTKPSSVTMEGTDGTWCLDSDGNGGYNTVGSCIDSCNSSRNDYCEGSTVRDGYCSGTWNGSSWANVHCEYGGYVCSSAGKSCSNGACVSSSPPSTMQNNRVCAQVITPAINSANGECREFPTPCDVPSGWSKTITCPTSTPNQEINLRIIPKGASSSYFYGK